MIEKINITYMPGFSHDDMSVVEKKKMIKKINITDMSALIHDDM
jgi:hypothetical protein